MKNLYREDLYSMSEIELSKVALNYCLEENAEVEEIIEQYEYNEGKLFDNVNDDILDEIMNGNWNDGAMRMLENYIFPNQLMDYVEEKQEEECNNYHWFTLSSASCITELFYSLRKDNA